MKKFLLVVLVSMVFVVCIVEVYFNCGDVIILSSKNIFNDVVELIV